MSDTNDKKMYSIDAEKSVLGSMLNKKEVIPDVMEKITAKDFYRESHTKIYRVINDLFTNDQAADTVTVVESLRDRDLLTDIGGVAYITELSDYPPNNAGYYASIVEEKSLLRQLDDTADQVKQRIDNYSGDIEELVNDVEQSVFEVTGEDTNRSEIDTFSNMIGGVVDDIEELAKTDGISGIPTGFSYLDKATSGLQDGNVIILGARPSMGKTALALNIAEYVAMEEEKNVGIFSLEMGKQQLIKRMMASRGNINSMNLRDGDLSAEDWNKVASIGQEFKEKAEISVADGDMNVSEIRSKARRMKQKNGLDMVVIDYLQLIQSNGQDNRNQQITNISRQVKLMARALQIPVILLSQLNRGVEQRNDKRPQLSDLRSSGSIEQDADIVIFLYRDAYYDENSDKEGIAEIIIAKQRNGSTGTFELGFKKEYAKFYNLSNRESRG